MRRTGAPWWGKMEGKMEEERGMPTMVLKIRRIDGQFSITYLREAERRRRSRTEIGGRPFPRPNFGLHRFPLTGAWGAKEYEYA